MTPLEEYYAAQRARYQAKADLEALTRRLYALAAALRDPRGVRLPDLHIEDGSPAEQIVVDPRDLVTWDELDQAIRALAQAEDAFRRAKANVTPESRRPR